MACCEIGLQYAVCAILDAIPQIKQQTSRFSLYWGALSYTYYRRRAYDLSTLGPQYLGLAILL